MANRLNPKIDCTVFTDPKISTVHAAMKKISAIPAKTSMSLCMQICTPHLPYINFPQRRGSSEDRTFRNLTRKNAVSCESYGWYISKPNRSMGTTLTRGHMHCILINLMLIKWFCITEQAFKILCSVQKSVCSWTWTFHLDAWTYQKIVFLNANYKLIFYPFSYI